MEGSQKGVYIPGSENRAIFHVDTDLQKISETRHNICWMVTIRDIWQGTLPMLYKEPKKSLNNHFP